MSGVLSLMVSQETLEDVVNSEVRLMPLAFPQRTNKGSKLQLLCRRHEAGRREVGRGAMGRDILHVSASRLVAEGLLPVCGGGCQSMMSRHTQVFSRLKFFSGNTLEMQGSTLTLQSRRSLFSE